MAKGSTTGIFKFDAAPIIATYINIFVPRQFKDESGKPKGEAKYDTTFIWKPDHVQFVNLKQTFVAVCRETWPSRDIAADFRAGEIRAPWITGEKVIEIKKKALAKEGKEYDGDEDYLLGNIRFKTSSKYRPKISIVSGNSFVDLEESTFAAHKAKFYSGCWMLAEVNLVAYKAKKHDDKDGVTAYLNHVLSLNRGDKIKIGKTKTAAETFSGYVGQLSAADPTGGAGLDDDIPF